MTAAEFQRNGANSTHLWHQTRTLTGKSDVLSVDLKKRATPYQNIYRSAKIGFLISVNHVLY